MSERAPLARLRDLCAGDGERLDLLEAALALAVLHREEPVDLAPLRQHVKAMADAVTDLVHRRGAAPERLADVIARSYAYRGDNETYDDLQNADLARERPLLQGFFDDQVEMVLIEGLGKEFLRAEFDGFHRASHRGVGGQHNDRRQSVSGASRRVVFKRALKPSDHVQSGKPR